MSHSRILSLVVALVIVTAAACGGGSDGPTTPAVTAQSITVTSPSDLLFVGITERFTATATMSDGSTRAVTGTWGGDAPGVATVEAGSGRITGTGSGMVTIFVDFEGRRGTKLIRGLPNFQGAWSGSYAVRSCSQSGQMALANLCGDGFSVNRVLPTNLNVTQARDRVEGRFFLGTLAGDGSGPVGNDGRLSLTGTIRTGASTIDTVWGLDSAAAGRITGGFNLIWRSSDLSGEVRVTADIRDLNRSSNASLTPSVGGQFDRTLEGLRRAIAIR